MKSLLTKEEGVSFLNAINRDFSSKQELIDDLDTMMYALFFVDEEAVNRRTQQDLACILKRWKEALK